LTDALTEAALAAAGFSASGMVSAGLSRAVDRREFAGQ